jgi:hypothetical protein
MVQWCRGYVVSFFCETARNLWVNVSLTAETLRRRGIETSKKIILHSSFLIFNYLCIPAF